MLQTIGKPLAYATALQRTFVAETRGHLALFQPKTFLIVSLVQLLFWSRSKRLKTNVQRHLWVIYCPSPRRDSAGVADSIGVRIVYVRPMFKGWHALNYCISEWLRVVMTTLESTIRFLWQVPGDIISRARGVHPILRVSCRVTSTLNNGLRVWIVGYLL